MSGPATPPVMTDASAFGRTSRHRILRAAMTAFAERGFDAVTIRDLAQQADVNLAAINYHFRSKDELYRNVIELALAEWISETVVLQDSTHSSSLIVAIKAITSALIAPVIERASHPLLLRLVAWDLLQRPSATRGGTAAECCAVIARLLKPHLPVDCPQEHQNLIAVWLVSQCLLLSPTLQNLHGDTGVDPVASEAYADIAAELALSGVECFLRRIGSLSPET